MMTAGPEGTVLKGTMEWLAFYRKIGLTEEQQNAVIAEIGKLLLLLEEQEKRLSAIADIAEYWQKHKSGYRHNV